MLTFFMTTHCNITFKLYLNVQTVISGPCWSAIDRYRLPIMVVGAGGDFTQTGPPEQSCGVCKAAHSTVTAAEAYIY